MMLLCRSRDRIRNCTGAERVDYTWNAKPFWELHADSIGLLQLAVTWYKIRHAGEQAYYYSRTGTSKTKKIQI